MNSRFNSILDDVSANKKFECPVTDVMRKFRGRLFWQVGEREYDLQLRFRIVEIRKCEWIRFLCGSKEKFDRFEQRRLSAIIRADKCGVFGEVDNLSLETSEIC